MLKSSLCDYNDTYILVKGTITVNNTGTAAAQNYRNKKVIFKNCVPFSNYISKRSNAQIDKAKDIDIVTPMYINDNYLKTSGSLCTD